MKTKQTIVYGLLAVILALTFTACPEEDDPDEGDLQKWTAVEDSTVWGEYSNSGQYLLGIYGIAYGNNRFVACSTNGIIAYSADGASWTAVSVSTFWLNAIAYGNNRFVAAGGEGKMVYSDNGASWTAVADSTFTSYIIGIAYGNNRFVAVGSNGKIAYCDW